MTVNDPGTDLGNDEVKGGNTVKFLCRINNNYGRNFSRCNFAVVVVFGYSVFPS